MAAAWFSVLLASGAFALELAAGGEYAFTSVLGWMTLIHAAIGLGEAVITGLVVRFLLLVRPDLIEHNLATSVSGVVPSRGWGRFALGALGVALAVALFLAPLASEKPDGLEFVGTEKVKFLPGEDNPAAAPRVPALIPDYEMPGLSGMKAVATATAGVVGTLVGCGVALVLSRSVELSRSKATPPPLLVGDSPHAS